MIQPPLLDYSLRATGMIQHQWSGRFWREGVGMRRGGGAPQASQLNGSPGRVSKMGTWFSRKCHDPGRGEVVAGDAGCVRRHFPSAGVTRRWWVLRRFWVRPPLDGESVWPERTMRGSSLLSFAGLTASARIMASSIAFKLIKCLMDYRSPSSHSSSVPISIVAIVHWQSILASYELNLFQLQIFFHIQN